MIKHLFSSEGTRKTKLISRLKNKTKNYREKLSWTQRETRQMSLKSSRKLTIYLFRSVLNDLNYSCGVRTDLFLLCKINLFMWCLITSLLMPFIQISSNGVWSSLCIWCLIRSILMSFEMICSICAWSNPFLWRLIISVLLECATQICSGRDSICYKVRIMLEVLVNNTEHRNKNLCAQQA